MENHESGKRKRDDSEQAVADSSDGRLPKRKVAVMIGYYGRGYRGSQINPNSRTIEGTLLDAFVSAGCITKDNASHPSKVGLQRAARTDANVSACCNLISLKLILTPAQLVQKDDQNQQQEHEKDDSLQKSLIEEHSKTSYYPLIRHINSFLPKHLKVWEIIRVQKSFNPRAFCDSRVYEYSLPTWLFLPPKPGSPLSERLNLDQQQDHDDPETNWWKDHSDLLEKDFKSIQVEKRASYRISQLMISRIQSVLDQFKGTHNFHNLTVGKAFTEKNAVRIMKDFNISKPFLVQEDTVKSSHQKPLETSKTEWISITFHGQSFMLHQIRKMIGLLVLVCRTRTPITIVKQLYGPKKVSIPKAPGIGLILRKLNFHGYNKKVQQMNQQSLKRKNKRKKGASQEDDDQEIMWDSIDCDRFEALFEHFKMHTLAKKIFVNHVSHAADDELPASKPSPTATALNLADLDTHKEEEDGKKGEDDKKGEDTKKEEDNKKEEKKSNLDIPPSIKSPEPIRASNVNRGDGDDEDGNADEDDGDVVPPEKLEGEDPFGVWMNYLDVYTGSDLDFLNPDGVLPNK
ncbi:hypothetical protein PCANC_23939 [Puccinia coronata f. sp. avenae]|uniref:Pseudouridine synthase I TruA alpha/beta domain-containing protein n=1 Tax=Puccinia coronata f. sp. avenae TaxID=200324 RepID=A0A2N5S770_9BASI|nr:hypothetical protein PCANC_23939 [Puccinia coronata f. sp. avenae]